MTEDPERHAIPPLAGGPLESLEQVPVVVDRVRWLVKVRIAESGKTDREIADALSLPVHTLTAILRGDRRLRLDQLLEILTVLGAAPLEFFQAALGGSPRPSGEAKP